MTELIQLTIFSIVCALSMQGILFITPLIVELIV